MGRRSIRHAERSGTFTFSDAANVLRLGDPLPCRPAGHSPRSLGERLSLSLMPCGPGWAKLSYWMDPAWDPGDEQLGRGVERKVARAEGAIGY